MNACQKGKRGEREWRDELKRFGLTEARRGRQFSGSDESPDVVGGWPGTHCEVKRVEKLNIDKAMDQAIRDADGKFIPYVAHRRNNKPWLITLRVEDLIAFAHMVVQQNVRQAKTFVGPTDFKFSEPVCSCNIYEHCEKCDPSAFPSKENLK